MSLIGGCSSCGIVVNEILAFIQQKMDVMDEQTMHIICDKSFTEDDVESAKSVLCKHVPEKTFARRVGEGKKKRILSDIIKILKETDPNNMPKFAVLNINKLPPVTFDYIDATAFLRDLIIIKSDVQKLKDESDHKKNLAIEEQIDLLKSEIKSLKLNVNELTKQNNNMPINSTVPSIDEPSKPNVKAKSTKDVNISTPSMETNKRATSDNATGEEQAPHTDPPTHPPRSYSSVLKNKNKVLVTGTNDKSAIKVIPKQRFLIVSRLDPGTTKEEVIAHIKTNADINCNAEKFMAFSKEYSTFKIGVNEQNLDLLLKEELWPRGVVVRHFRYYNKRISGQENAKKLTETK